MNSITIDELLKLKNINIIDIRDYTKYYNGHITGAVNISENELLINHNKYLNMNKIYYIYCDYGNRSRVCVNRLNNMGYNTVNIIGGYHNYLFR
jgi:rhodanese-related sulfurtransferase